MSNVPVVSCLPMLSYVSLCVSSVFRMCSCAFTCCQYFAYAFSNILPPRVGECGWVIQSVSRINDYKKMCTTRLQASELYSFRTHRKHYPRATPMKEGDRCTLYVHTHPPLHTSVFEGQRKHHCSDFVPGFRCLALVLLCVVLFLMWLLFLVWLYDVSVFLVLCFLLCCILFVVVLLSVLSGRICKDKASFIL